MPAHSDVWTGCALLLTVACTVAVAGMVVLINYSRHERGAKVQAYDESVRAWHLSAQQLERALFSLNVSWLGGGNRVRLVRNRSDESTLPDDGRDLLPYEPLRFEWRGPLLSEGSGWSELPLSVSLESVWRHGHGLACPMVAIDGALLALGYVDSVPSSSRQQCATRYGGSYEATERSCVVYRALRELCVKVSIRNGCWAPDGAGGGFGCQPGEDGSWAVGVYETRRGRRSSRPFHRVAPAEASQPLLRVRHASDPRVVAYQITGGTLNFGVSDTVKAVGGLEMLLLALALATPALLFFGLRWHKACGAGSEASVVRFSRLATAPAELALPDRLSEHRLSAHAVGPRAVWRDSAPCRGRGRDCQ